VDRVVDVSAASDSSVWFLLQIDLNLREPGTPPPPSRGISLRIAGYGEAGTLEETYQESTPQSCGGEVNDDLIKRSTWRQEFHGSGDDGLFENWQMGTPGADLLATKSYWDSGGAGMAEQTRLELWHTPIT
jgi:hypothetical protein